LHRNTFIAGETVLVATFALINPVIPLKANYVQHRIASA